MRKIALILAAALIVSAPLVVNFRTDSYAATAKKAKKPSKNAKAESAVQGGERPYDFNTDPNTAFIRALSDLFSGKQGTSGGSAAPGASKGKAVTKGGVASKRGAGGGATSE